MNKFKLLSANLLILLAGLVFVSCSSSGELPLCGDKEYYPDDAALKPQCRDGALHFLCGAYYYNSKTDFCLKDDYLLEKSIRPLCNGQRYGKDKKCENSVIIQLKECGQPQYKFDEYGVPQLYYNEYYNPATHFCNNLTITELCGGEEYNTNSQECINGEVLEKCRTEPCETI